MTARIDPMKKLLETLRHIFPFENVSKEFETQFVNTLFMFFISERPHTYMIDVFSPGLLKWIQWQIHNDLATDIFAEFEMMKRQRDEYGVRNSQTVSENNHLKRRIETLEEDYKKQVDIDRSIVTNLESRVEQLKTQRQENHIKYNDLVEENNRLQDITEAQERVIMELKSKLYDLLIAQKQPEQPANDDPTTNDLEEFTKILIQKYDPDPDLNPGLPIYNMTKEDPEYPED
jgi:hypothetical protein